MGYGIYPVEPLRVISQIKALSGRVLIACSASYILLNGEYVLERARQLSAHLDNGKNPTDVLVAAAIRCCWERHSSPDELKSALTFLHPQLTPIRKRLTIA
ncbi:MAG: hypothetical protein M2R46_05258 [Verrucomicrobia subdivision 3 bacterium]|nr:hypothetical protein [Limisphaerales bacterium]